MNPDNTFRVRLKEIFDMQRRLRELIAELGVGGGGPAAHATSHEDGGSDELDVTGLTGLLATPQTPTTHATSHQNGGADEISVAGLSGLLADGQTPLAHASIHQNGGGDEISVAGLSGLLADGQTPLTHASSHQNGGGDEVSVAGLSGLLADAQTPLAHASSHQNGGGDEISVAGLSGLLADGQTPLAHQTSHQSGGSDAIKIDDLSAPDDNTDLDATTSAHGLMKKFPGGSTTFLRADGTFAAVTPGGGGGVGGTWVLVENWTYSSDISEKDFLNLSGYSEIFVSIVAVTLSVSGARRVRVSTDNGSTFLTTSGDYVATDTLGIDAANQGINVHSTSNTLARSGQLRIQGFNTATANKPTVRPNRTDAPTGYIPTATPLNAIRVDGSAGGNLTGGSIQVWGRV